MSLEPLLARLCANFTVLETAINKLQFYNILNLHTLRRYLNCELIFSYIQYNDSHSDEIVNHTLTHYNIFNYDKSRVSLIIYYSRYSLQ